MFFEKEFELRYFEMDRNGLASPVAILTLLEETASDHCLSIGYGLPFLFSQDIGWLLLSGYMQMERYPALKEKITIKTWLSLYKNIRGYRENIIYDAQGNIIGRAKGQWLFYNIAKRRPVPIYEEIQNQWSFHPEVSVDHDILSPLNISESVDYSSRFKVRRFDLDSNKHVNNLRYLQWLLETIPDEIMDNSFLHTIDGRFLEEAHLEDSLISESKVLDGFQNFSHGIRNEKSNRLCASAQTSWRTIK